ncbi:MAG: ATP-binding cassette domain-containing protein [Gemmatimonadales bacterium]|nr:ATP-binding cassette domain-containing protein [Gemmatimonadales bacterium]
MSDPILACRGLAKAFRTRKGSVEAVRGVDLVVAPGQVYGFLGPNGAGKTTTLRILATLLDPDGGDATVAGHDLRREPARVRERIGYVSQQGGADNRTTALENLVLQGELYRLARPDAIRRAAELLDAFALREVADRPAMTLSGGQRRRLDIALGLVHRPALLFLDEPTIGLDPQSRARMWDEVRALAHAGMTVFLTTHYLDEADLLCRRLAIIDGGRIVAEGTPQELKRGISGDCVTVGFAPGVDVAAAQALLAPLPFVRETVAEQGDVRLYVDEGERALPQVLRALDGAGVPVGTIALSRPTLDDVFLKQTGRSLREEAA